jgi:hypothetical protein
MGETTGVEAVQGIGPLDGLGCEKTVTPFRPFFTVSLCQKAEKHCAVSLRP